MTGVVLGLQSRWSVGRQCSVGSIPMHSRHPAMPAFRLIAFLEGVSYILLLGVATPIKYLNSDPTYVKLLGMPHGILFMVYVLFAFKFKQPQNWSSKELNIVLLCSILPFGTFYADKKYLK